MTEVTAAVNWVYRYVQNGATSLTLCNGNVLFGGMGSGATNSNEYKQSSTMQATRFVLVRPAC